MEIDDFMEILEENIHYILPHCFIIFGVHNICVFLHEINTHEYFIWLRFYMNQGGLVSLLHF
jgi:hypothetical protein